VAASFTVSGFGRRIDGDYELDITDMTNYDWHVIKEVASVTMANFNEALLAGDQEVLYAMVAVCLIRAGVGNFQQVAAKPSGLIWQAKPGQLMWNIGEVDDDADPLSQTSSESGESGTVSGKKTSSSKASSTGSVPTE